ncbi:BTAD domain-containing putative transcriptional regulator [Saccharothrix sp. BKS2]|uniref:BTAD domain-containing putative transcriptional regulator n=1 Tax=Saccharothrix sp. BKS2 TaxID=3064400 RepID=UPI0039E7D5A0
MTTASRTTRREPRRPPRAPGWRATGRLLAAAAGPARALAATALLVGLLAGLPWALVHFIGWPLPDHLPSRADVRGVLSARMSTVCLLDVLACAGWLLWARFTLDTVRCAADVARHARIPQVPAAGPVRRIAAVLVGATLISILGHRAAATPAGPPTGPDTGREVVATAPARQHPSQQGTPDIRSATHTASGHPDSGAPARRTPATSAVVLPYDPSTGLHDSLWRMAQRTLGDGHRWPEIYELNKGKPQPDGGTFTQPGLIFPGEEMALPQNATTPPMPSHRPAPPPTTQPSPGTPSPGSPTTPAYPTTRTPHLPQAPPPQVQPDTEAPRAPGEPGFGWGEELFVGLGLASAVSAALTLARRRHRRRYRPGSGDRTDLPVAPVVYQLRLAHLRTNPDDEPDPDDPDPDPDPDPTNVRPQRAPAPRVVPDPDDTARDDQRPVFPVGVRDGREIALSLAAARGLGLIGAGAAAAARALLITVLTTTTEAARIVVPAQDLAPLLGRRATRAPLPASVHVTADLDTALDALEAETLMRTGRSGRSHDTGCPPFVLVARTPEGRHRRLQAILDNGCGVGVTGLLLGPWPAGITAYVRADGTVSTTNPGLGEPLRGTAMFRLGEDHTADLMTLLHHADPAPDLDTEPGAGPCEQYLPGGTASEPAVPVDVSPRIDTGLEILHPQPDRPTATREERTDIPADAPGVVEPVNPATSRAAAERDRTGDIPDADLPPLRISVLGPPRVWWRPGTGDTEEEEREITSAFQPRTRELLVFLALHPDGASRETLIAALWATSPPDKTTNTMNTGLTRLRRALTAATGGAMSDVVLTGEGRCRLDPALVEVDYHRFADAVTARRTATTEKDRIDAYRRIVEDYTGPLADGLSTEWLETAREAIRRDAIDAVAALARALVEDDPRRTLDLLEMARAFDPHNELIYRDIMRLQERLGQPDAIPRTLTLLTTRLAEIKDQPTPQTVDLAERLRRRHDTDNPHPSKTDRAHRGTG